MMIQQMGALPMVPANDAFAHPGVYVPGLLSALVAGEIFETAPAQAAAFYTAVGRRMAGLIALDTVAGVDDLAASANGLWQRLGWGAVKIAARGNGIAIHHTGLPQGMEGDIAGHWPQVAAALLEGAYDAWFRALGSPEALTTRLVEQTVDSLEFCHGV